MQTVTLVEYQSKTFAREMICESVAEHLWQEYRNQIVIEYPSFKTDHRWQLTAQGWVGFIPASPKLGFALQPKVAIHNLFHMLEVVYGLPKFPERNELLKTQSVSQIYERLALILAGRVLERMRKGIYRTYIPKAEQLPYVRGQMQLSDVQQRPWQVNIPCHYEKQTADVEDNRILYWTLNHILRSGLEMNDALPRIRKAKTSLQNWVTLSPYSARNCQNRTYNRLNQDYSPMHALCAFFLENSGPNYEHGEHRMVPFLVDMARLYEQFVAAWLKEHLERRFHLAVQERHHIDMKTGIYFNMDLVVYDTETERVRWVMDTKYKAPESTPATADVAQVVTYAEAKGVKDAILIYPITLAQPIDVQIGDIRVRSLTFALDGDLDEAGVKFLESIFD